MEQEMKQTAVDTLTQSYSEEWEAMSQLEQASGMVQWMATNDLMPVVLVVSLTIWFVLLFYLVRMDKKLTRLEEKMENGTEETE
ncbi:MAG: CcmD family protein [Bacteroidota bacterium]